MDLLIAKLFAGGFSILLVMGAGMAFAFGRIVQKRVGGIESAANAIMTGNFQRRMPLDGSGGEFDRLSHILNQMLDRIETLLDNIKQVSSDIAHDLRTPLNRLRTRLEHAERLAGGPEQTQMISSALNDCDDILSLFGSMLAITEIEGRSARHRFVEVGLGEAVGEIVDAYVPAIEEAGMTMGSSLAAGIVKGDRQLLQRCIANLLDNVLAHTPRGTRVNVTVESDLAHMLVVVEDDGPGIPPSDHDRAFRRLTRLDPSRSAPGHGLGLSMVAAIVHAHDGSVRIGPSAVGLRIEIMIARIA
jgi:signal transduction histidine kinase